MKSEKKGKPAQKKTSSVASWTKIVLVLVCIMFAGVMIITSLGTGWLVNMKPAGNGDTAVVDITLKDKLGRTVFTTNQNLYAQAIEKNQAVWLGQPMTIIVNSSTGEMVEPVPATIDGKQMLYFAFLGPEKNQIADALLGMKQKSSKRVVFEDNPGFQQVAQAEGFNTMGGNFTTAMNDQQMIFGFTTSPLINAEDNASAQYALRTVTLKDKMEDSITIDYGYNTADITILQLSHTA